MLPLFRQGTPDYSSLTDSWPIYGPGMQQSTSSAPDFYSLFSRSDNSALDRYSQLLGTVPNQEDFEPDFSHKLAAGLIGLLASGTAGPLGGIKLSRSLTDEPYQRALDKYRLNLEGAKTLAELEDKRTGRDINYANMLESRRLHNAQISNYQADNVRADQAEIDKVVNETISHDIARDAEKGRNTRFDLGQETATDNLGERKRHNKVMEGLGQERVDTYKKGVAAFDAERKRRERVPITEQHKSQQDAVGEIISEDPDLERYFDTDQEGNYKLKKVGDDIEGRGPMSLAEMQGIRRKIIERQQKILSRTRTNFNPSWVDNIELPEEDQ